VERFNLIRLTDMLFSVLNTAIKHQVLSTTWKFITNWMNVNFLNTRILPEYKWDFRSFGMSRALYLYLITEISGQPIFKDIAVTAVPFKMGPIGCPEASVIKYQSTAAKHPRRGEYGMLLEWQWRGKTEILGEKSSRFPNRWPQTPHYRLKRVSDLCS